jgi:AcrR family transcriptional regulator
MMARTGGEATRKRILAVAEKQFAARGFDATSVDQIARSAGVNKALIYYHFNNKHDLILELFQSIIAEVAEHTDSGSQPAGADHRTAVRGAVKAEVDFLLGRKRVLSVMLAEALKSSQRDDLLFRCAELVMRAEHGGDFASDGRDTPHRQARLRLVHEFFTGFIPMVMFVALRDSWCRHFGHDPDQVIDDFIESFERSHLASQEVLEHDTGK